MNQFSYENRGANTYLVYALRPDDKLDTLSLGMLANNKIPGLAATVFTQMDAQKYIKYNITAKVTVRQFFTGAVNRQRLLGVFRGIVDAMISAEDYMIDQGTILLDLDCIFTDVSTCETVLICLPVVREAEQKTDLCSFFKTIMFSTQFDQRENCDYVAKIMNYLNSAAVFSHQEFKELLQSIQKEPVTAAPRPQPGSPRQSMGQSAAIPQRPMQPNAQYRTPQAAAPKPVVAPPPVASAPQAPKQKQMTLFNLLNHYSKANKAIYKEQKAARKEEAARLAAQNAIQNPAQNANIPPAPQKKKKSRKEPANPSFTVPGAPVSTSFPVPGQQPPAQAAPAAKVSAAPGQAAEPSNFSPAGTAMLNKPAPAQQTDFGKTTVLDGGMVGETTILGSAARNTAIRPHLLRSKNGERIEINKPLFRIGKEKSYVDYFIPDNTAISRSHALIVSRDGEYFLMDTNSTNHTFVNGGMIQSNTEVKLSHGTKIRFANEEFEFKLY